MSDAGYAFDFDKKELMKIEDGLITGVEIPFGAKDSELEEVFYSIPNGFHAEIEDDKVVIKKGEQKPWSEEDEKYVKDLAAYFTGGLSLKHAEEDIANWLKSLRPQSHWKPSDEQIKVLHDVAAYIDNSIYPNQKDILANLYLQLKKLREE